MFSYFLPNGTLEVFFKALSNQPFELRMFIGKNRDESSLQSHLVFLNATLLTAARIHSQCECTLLYTDLKLWIYSNRLLCVFLKIYLFMYQALSVLSCSMWDLVPPAGIEPRPPHWKLEVLLTGPPGKSLCGHF